MIFGFLLTEKSLLGNRIRGFLAPPEASVKTTGRQRLAEILKLPTEQYLATYT